MDGFKSKLGGLIGKKIRLSIGMPDAYVVWTGRIVDISTDEIYGGYLVFEFIDEEVARMGIKQAILNLGHVIIWAIDILVDDFTPESYVTCPECEKSFKISLIGRTER